MDFGSLCSAELEKLTGGHWRDNSLYFTLKEINRLPHIIKSLNYIDELVISPFHITDSSVMEAYWCTLSIKTVNDVQDKFTVLLSEAGKSRIEEIEDHYIEQWDNTYYEILNGDIKGYIESLNRYSTYMERREILLKEEYDLPNHNNQGIYYKIW